MSLQDQLISALSQPKVRKGLEEWCREVMNLANAVCCDALGEEFENLKDNWPDSLQFSLGQSVEGPAEWLFNEAIKKLPTPAIVTSQELSDALEVYLEEADSRLLGDFDALYECFLDHVRYRILKSYRSAEIPLCLVRIDDDQHGLWLFESGMAIGHAQALGTQPDLPSKPDSTEETPSLTLWTHEDLKLEASIPQTGALRGNQSRSEPLVTRFTGRLSGGAAKTLIDDLIPVVRALLDSIFLIRPDTRQPNQLGLPKLRLQDVAEDRTFVTSCTSLLYRSWDKKDTMPRRFLNAVRLLAEADRQTLPAIRLALSVTAIEALLGKKGPDLSASLADFIPILLEPDASERGKASTFVKRIYDARSRTLHGDHLNAESREATDARTLAAGCLYGLWFRSDFQRRMGETPDTPDALLKELKDLRWAGCVPDGVPDLPLVRALWKDNSPRKLESS
jgi:hypothetical protein